MKSNLLSGACPLDTARRSSTGASRSEDAVGVMEAGPAHVSGRGSRGLTAFLDHMAVCPQCHGNERELCGEGYRLLMQVSLD